MISLLLPSRGRPHALAAFIQSVHATVTQPDQVEIVIRLDEDDPTLGDHNVTQYADDPLIKFIVGPRSTLSDYWNECWRAARGPIFGQMGDDIRFRTPGWDRQVETAFAHIPDKIALVYGDDGGSNGRHFATHGFLHRNWTDTLGYFTAPYFSSDFGDSWLNDLAQRVGRMVFIDILTDHMHPVHGKGVWDQTHQERLARHAQDRPQDIFEAKTPERIRDSHKLQNVIQLGVLPPLWSILICSVRPRIKLLQRLLNALLPQATTPEVEVVVYEDDFEHSGADKRNALVQDANGRYVSFVDDDDLVPPYYIDKVLSAIKSHWPDYVGWRMQLWIDNQKQRPTFHSLKYAGWSEDQQGYYRRISHLNPILTGIARLGTFRYEYERGAADDVVWQEQIEATGLVRTEVYIPEIMYEYWSVPVNSLWRVKNSEPTGVPQVPLPRHPQLRAMGDR